MSSQEHAYEPSQKYKEGKYIVEKARILKVRQRVNACTDMQALCYTDARSALTEPCVCAHSVSYQRAHSASRDSVFVFVCARAQEGDW